MILDLHPMLVVTFTVAWTLVKIYRPKRCKGEWCNHVDE